MKYNTSIIIPTYNDPDGIMVTLNSLINQDYAHKYEIIVIDNNSSDNTFQVLTQFKKNLKRSGKYELKLLQENTTQSSYAARNLGIKHADGEILCFIDSDMWVDHDYLTKVTQMYHKLNPKGDQPFYMGCKVEIVMKEGNIYEKYDKITGFPMEKYLEKYHFVGAGCLIINKKTIERVGRFNSKLFSGGDREFGERYYATKHHQYFCGNIRVYHPARNSLKDHLKKKYRIGKGLVDLRTVSPIFIFKLLLPPRPIKLMRKCYNSKISISLKTFLKIYFLDYLFGHLVVLTGIISRMIYDNR